MERSNSSNNNIKSHPWKKHAAYFSTCFIIGFFTGFIPTSSKTSSPSIISHSLLPSSSPPPPPPPLPLLPSPTKQLLIVVTCMGSSSFDIYQKPLLHRLVLTLSLVPPPLLWVVVESPHQGSLTSGLSATLRKTKLMYRHLVLNQLHNNNTQDSLLLLETQINAALSHIHLHSISGFLLFAPLNTTYHLHFFHHARNTEVFGVWPIAFMKGNKRRVMIEGPICESSQIMGWHGRDKVDNTSNTNTKFSMDISNFGFNTFILSDPKIPKNPMDFIKQEILKGEGKVKGIQSCSKIMLWKLQF